MPKTVADIVQIIEPIRQLQYDSYVADRLDTAFDSLDVDTKVIDGPVLVNMLPPGKATTFNDY